MLLQAQQVSKPAAMFDGLCRQDFYVSGLVADA